MTIRKIEVFSAGCPLCEETIEMVNRLSCPPCQTEIIDMKDVKGAARARELNVRTVPAVAIDGKLAECCAGKGPDEVILRRAGLGQAIN